MLPRGVHGTSSVRTHRGASASGPISRPARWSSSPLSRTWTLKDRSSWPDAATGRGRCVDRARPRLRHNHALDRRLRRSGLCKGRAGLHGGGPCQVFRGRRSGLPCRNGLGHARRIGPGRGDDRRCRRRSSRRAGRNGRWPDRPVLCRTLRGCRMELIFFNCCGSGRCRHGRLGDHWSCGRLGGYRWRGRRRGHDGRRLPWLRDDFSWGSFLCRFYNSSGDRGRFRVLRGRFPCGHRLLCGLCRGDGRGRFFGSGWRRNSRDRRGRCLGAGRDRRHCASRGLFFLLLDGLQHVPGFGDVRQVDLGPDLLLPSGLGRSGRGLCSAALEVRAHTFGLIGLQGAGMRLFLGHADFRQRIQNRLALYFQLARQIVNSNFTHPPLSPSSGPSRRAPCPQIPPQRPCSHYPLACLRPLRPVLARRRHGPTDNSSLAAVFFRRRCPTLVLDGFLLRAVPGHFRSCCFRFH